eukprot:CAMPEP_0197689078 /NCGR_PEP_ID=MMETSP1338-20131121/106343_1 /TAXON_ID=43686 ORGANISM="Pelagodinium beii, Strain RCC1491" /NCGR_SAMPLE_ID=MMETSP1338 /ASSEMBLY_ACC=CAM_ASM_000754 /LENGTH=707 /DNA_ID=CAMNT_0043271381 /DNA_START=31 /DNA_END=2154 /DNA_ORIENTATION=-
MALGVGAFISVVLPSLAVAICMYALFCCLRGKYVEVYEPRTLKVQRFEEASERLPDGYCKWLLPLLKLPLKVVSTTCGVDAAGYLAVQVTLITILTIATVLCLPVLLPVYAGAGGLQGFETISLSNVSPASDLLWAPAVLCWPIAGIAYACIYRCLRKLQELKIAGLHRSCHPRHYTLLLRNVQEPSETALEERIRAAAGEHVLHVDVVKDLGKAYDKDFGKYKKAWLAWKRAEVGSHEVPDSVPMTRKGFCGPQVEAVPHLAEQRDDQRQVVESKRSDFDDLPCRPCAFVTFTSLSAASAALAELKDWAPEPASEPRSIIWANLKKCRKPAQLFAMRRCVGLAIAFIIILWAIPVAATQGLANLDDLAKKAPFLEWVTDLPESVKSILQGLLPTVALAILNALVLPIFTLLSVSSGLEDKQQIHKSLMRSYYWFLMVNSFFVVVISGSVFNQLATVLQDPSELQELLGRALPQVGSFFVSFITLRALATPPVALSLVGKLIPTMLLLKFCKTDEERAELMDPGFHQYGVMYAEDLFVWSVVIAYAVISPIILPFGLLYFALKHITSKYLLCYVYRSEYQAGGAQALSAFQLVLAGLLIGQLTVVCVLSIKQSLAAVLCAPLPFITLGFMIWMAFSSTLADQALPATLTAELEDESRLERWHQELREHVLAEPAYFSDLDQPAMDKFFWRDISADVAGGEPGHAPLL